MLAPTTRAFAASTNTCLSLYSLSTKSFTSGCSSSTFSIAFMLGLLLASATICNGVFSSEFSSLALKRLSLSSHKAFTTSTLPASMAYNNVVIFLLSWVLTSRFWCFKSSLTTCPCHLRAAKWRGVASRPTWAAHSLPSFTLTSGCHFKIYLMILKWLFCAAEVNSLLWLQEKFVVVSVEVSILEPNVFNRWIAISCFVAKWSNFSNLPIWML